MQHNSAERLNQKFGKLSAAKKDVVSTLGDEMAKKSNLPKGFYDRAGRLYVSGKHEGKTVYLNTGRTVKDSIAWANGQDRQQVFLNLIVEKEEKEVKKASLSLREFGDSYLEKTSYKRKALTQTDYTNIFHNIILSDFEHFPVESIKVQDIEAFLWKIKGVYSGSRCLRIKSVFNRILSSAADHELMLRNPFEFQDIKDIAFDSSPREKISYSRIEILRMLEASEGWLKAFLHLGFVYAIRPGELLHIQWKNVDLKENVIYLKGSISKGEVTNGNACTPDGKIIKCHVRTIKIFNDTAKLLKEHFLSGTCNTDYMFSPTGSKNEYWTDIKSINENHFQPLLKEIGVEYKELRTMRNSSITQQLGEGRSFAFNHMLSGQMNKDNDTLRELQKEVGHAVGSDVTTSHYFDANSLDHTGEMEKAEEEYKKLFSDKDEDDKSA